MKNGGVQYLHMYLVPQGHEVVGKDEVLEDDHPTRVLQPLEDVVCQYRHGAVGVIGQVYEV